MEKLTYPGIRIPVTAGEALAKERLVGADGSYPSAGGVVLGATEIAAASGDSTGLVINGIVKVTSAAAVTVGAQVKTDAAGKVLPQGGSGVIVGTAIDAASDADESIRIKLI